MAEQIILIRHCATGAGYADRLVGSSDVAASREGLEEVPRLAPLLERFRPEVWLCSPQRRARQTADRLLRQCAITEEYRVDRRLREIDFGRWEGRSFAEICAAEPEQIEAWRRFTGFSFPGGESVASFETRMMDMLSSLHREPATRVGVVTHGGVIRTMICLALGLDVAHYLLFAVRPCRAAVIDLYPEGGVLAGLNI